VKRQYIGNLGKIENGIVAVTAYGVVDHITLPCCLKSINRAPQGFDVYRSKTDCRQMMRELQAMGFGSSWC